jgi:hypothetical protein
MAKIQFTGNPVGLFNLVYDIGEVIDLPDDLAAQIIEAKVAVPFEEDSKVERATNKEAEKAISSAKDREKK